jgi:hypothetical protein
MKRNVLGLLAVVFAIAVSSFTVNKATNLYFKYNGGLDQFAIGSYDSPELSLDRADGSGVVNWVMIIDQDDDGITSSEFTDAVTPLDGNTNGTLNDQSDATHIDVKSAQ